MRIRHITNLRHNPNIQKHFVYGPQLEHIYQVVDDVVKVVHYGFYVVVIVWVIKCTRVFRSTLGSRPRL